MKSFYWVCISVLFSGMVYSAELVPDKQARILMLNGIKTESKTSAIELDEGINQAVISISMKFKRGSKERVFDSRPFIIMFDSKQSDINIQSPKLYDYEQAVQHFKKKPDVKLISDEEIIAFSYAEIEPRSGFLPYYGLEEIVSKYNRNNNIAFGENAELVASATVIGVSSNANGENVKPLTAPAVVTNLNQLKAWYLKASKAERKEFRRWMIDQE